MTPAQANVASVTAFSCAGVLAVVALGLCLWGARIYRQRNKRYNVALNSYNRSQPAVVNLSHVLSQHGPEPHGSEMCIEMQPIKSNTQVAVEVVDLNEDPPSADPDAIMISTEDPQIVDPNAISCIQNDNFEDVCLSSASPSNADATETEAEAEVYV